MKILILLLAAASAHAADAKLFENRKSDVRTLLQKQQYVEALEKASAINREWPDDQAGYQLMAAAHLGLGNYGDAEKAIQWMLDLRIGKSDAPGWLLVAQFREMTGDVEGAIEAASLSYNRAFPSDPAFGRAVLVYSAHLHRVGGKLSEAEKQLKTVLGLNAADRGALEELTMLRVAQGRPQEALAILRQISDVKGDDPLLLRVRFNIAELSKAPEDCAAFERAALASAAGTGHANRELALYYAGVGHRAGEAEKVARKEALWRHDIFTLDALAAALWSNRKPAEARSTMRQVLAIGTRDPGIVAHARLMGVEIE